MNMNSGYLGWSISRRAGQAYEDGLAPLSKIGSGKFIKAAAKFLGAAEWHHTSKFCNRTDFYSVAGVLAVARQLKATGLKADAAVAAMDAKRSARRASRATARSRYARARELLQQAKQYDAKAAEFEARAAATTSLDETLFERNRAADYREMAAGWRASARKARS